MKLIFLFFFLFLSKISFGQTGETELYEELDTVERELNLVCNELKDKLDSTDRQALLKSQSAWIQFREANCNFTSQHDRGGVIGNKKRIDCFIETTDERTKELKSILEDGF